MTRARMLMLTAGLLAACGCALPQENFLQRPIRTIVWPKPPDAPHVRYAGELASAGDVNPRKTFGQAWDELFFGPGAPNVLVSPHAVAVHAQRDLVAVADGNSSSVHLFDVPGRKYTRITSYGQPPVAFQSPVGVAWMGDSLWVVDSKIPALVLFDAARRGRAIASADLKRPASVTYAKGNDLCYVCDAGAHAILVFDGQGRAVGRFGSHGAGPGQLNFPSSVAVGPEGTVFVADTLNFRIQKFSSDGTPLDSFGRKGDAAGDLALPKGIAVDDEGHVWVVDAHFENVQAFADDGALLMAFGEEGQGPGQFWLPAGCCIDTRRRLWVADTYNRRIQVFELLP